MSKGAKGSERSVVVDDEVSYVKKQDDGLDRFPGT
jgi:hypothetical protein